MTGVRIQKQIKIAKKKTKMLELIVQYMIRHMIRNYCVEAMKQEKNTNNFACILLDSFSNEFRGRVKDS